MRKSFFNKLYQYVFKKSLLNSLVLLFIFILFHKPIESVISNTIVRHALKNVDSIWYTDIVFIIIILGGLFVTVQKYKRYIPSIQFSSFFISLTIIYCFYRFGKSPWIFKSFSFFTSLKYLDVLIISSIEVLILFIKPNKEIKKISIDSFFDDEPLGNEKDELGYTVYTKLLAQKINSSNFNKAFAIGINGKWGSGKTSFINLVKKNIDASRCDIIEIDFNPWSSNNPKTLIQDFFQSVQEKIKPYHSSLSSLLISYSNKLVSLNRSTFSQTIQASVAAITGFESLNSLFKEINSALIKIDKKLIIYIDDLDRLDKTEILEVIRLIRNTANFHNTFFIVAYDRNYIINALKEHNDYKQEQFLEKIFQIEINLPYFNTDVFRYKLVEKLKSKFSEEYHAKFNEDIIGSPKYVPTYLNNWLESMRDVTRLSNALILNLSTLLGEVDFADFLRLELLRLKFPSVYELLFKRTGYFFETLNRSNELNHYKLINNDKSNITPTNEEDNNAKTKLESHLLKNKQDLSIPKNEIDKIIQLVTDIFENTYSYGYNHRSLLSVIYPSKFHRYFAYSLLEGNLSEIEFSKVRAKSQEEFNLKITDWVKKGLADELAKRFKQIKDFDNREDFEKVITAIFHYANIKVENPNWPYRNILGYDSKDLLNKLDNYENRLVKKYYNGNGEALEQFIRHFFYQSPEPYYFEATLIRYLRSGMPESFPLNANELNDIILGYLEKFCNQAEKIDSKVWHLYNNCKYIPSGSASNTNQEIIPERSKEIFKDFILKKDFDGFLFDIIEPFDEKSFSVRKKIVLEIFENWDAFKEILKNQSEEKWKYLKEFKDFFLKFESKNFEEYVPFDFHVIPIDKKLRK